MINRGRNIFAIGIFWVTIIPVFAQQIDNKTGQNEEEQIHFDSSFIAKNRIAAIDGKIITKNDGESIKDYGLSCAYSFNPAGQLLKYAQSYRLGPNQIDTVLRYYDFIRGVLQLETQVLSKNSYQWNYHYDKDQRIKKTVYSKGPDTKNVLAEGERNIVVSEETFEHVQVNDTVIKKLYYNSYSKPYREDLSTTNRQGYLIEESSRYLISNRIELKKYSYDERGRLKQKLFFESDNVLPKKKLIFLYDSWGNLTYVDIFEKGQLAFRIDYLYNDDGLLEAVIKKEVSNGRLKIFKFTYTFFDTVSQ